MTHTARAQLRQLILRTGQWSAAAVTLLAGLMLAALPAAAADETSSERVMIAPMLDEGPRPVVLELYTSQGCPMCPPADSLFTELAREPGVVALTFGVDIWDYRGWKDTLADPRHTQRQRVYNKRLRGRAMFTPQAIVDGRYVTVGSQGEKLRHAVLYRREQGPALVNVGMARQDQTVQVTVSAPSTEFSFEPKGTLYIMPLRDHEDVVIGGGSNQGLVQSYTNVVHGYELLGEWYGDPVAFTYELDAETAYDGIAVVLHHDRLGEVMGANILRFTDYPEPSNAHRTSARE